MNPIHRSLSSLFAVALATQPLCCQEPDVRREPPRVNITFGGGMLEEFVRQLQTDHPSANIVLALEAKDKPVPWMRLVNTTVAQALKAVADATSSAHERITVSESQGPGDPVYAVVVMRSMVPNQPVRTDLKEVRVFSLADLTEVFPGDPKTPPIALLPETILTAIEVVRKDMMVPPRMRYHSASGLLFVHGTAEQVQIVREVLTNLERDQQKRRERLRRGAAGEAAEAPGKDK